MQSKKPRLIDGFLPTECHIEISVTHIVTAHYFIYPENFYFPGESHDFWEFLYVDKGEVEVMADTTLHTLAQGQIIFHEPGEFHSVVCNNRTAPNLVVLSFVCKSPVMDFFRGKILSVSEKERRLLSTIIQEAEEAFDSRLEDPYLKGMHRRKSQRFGCEQILRCSIELLLLQFYRQTAKVPIRQTTNIKTTTSYLRMAGIFNYLEDNVTQRISLNEVCRAASMSRASLEKMFREYTGQSVMEYFDRFKAKEAKRLLQDGRYNVSDIADMLGYSSIHYFSRRFKSLEGLSPTEYAKSIHSEQWIRNSST
ncbi:MAG: helix-turn-helix domain-containing protein [Sphaerochaetaceae bacterium]|nr:helix-turn-helix domain-containing protein [Sphaerochaetaceae bacterium]